MKRVLLVIAFIFFSLPVWATEVPILQAGWVEITDIPKNNKNWFGLYKKEEGKYALVPVKFRVESFFHELADGEENKNNKEMWSGRNLFAIPLDNGFENKDSIILIQLRKLEKGDVATSFPANDSYIDKPSADFSPRMSVDMQLYHKQYRISTFSRGKCDLTMNYQYNDKNVEKRIYLKDQVLAKDFDLDEKGMPLYIEKPYIQTSCDTSKQLVWAGDLDGDKKLDVILSYQTDGYTYPTVLFLSSYADVGQHVKLVGEFSPPAPC